jgi:hypothetical protein
MHTYTNKTINNTLLICTFGVAYAVAVLLFLSSPFASATALAKPTKTTLASVPSAENQTYTTTNRLFVTGDKGIYEVVPTANKTATLIERAPKQSCAFGGIVETFGYLYVNCSGGGSSHIYAAKLTADPSFKRIYTLKGTLLANGLTADNAGRLYVATTFNGQILQLTPSGSEPLQITKRVTWIRAAGLFTNGVKFAPHNSSIYWTDFLAVKRAEINSDGKPGRVKLLFGALSYFDDLAIDKSGILVADFIGGSIHTYTAGARPTGVIYAKLSGPSSVQRARAPLPAGTLIVTERSAGRVTLVTP